MARGTAIEGGTQVDRATPAEAEPLAAEAPDDAGAEARHEAPPERDNPAELATVTEAATPDEPAMAAEAARPADRHSEAGDRRATAVAAPASRAAGSPSRVEHVAARDGTALLTRHWPVERGDPWASLLLVHGLAEHSGRYEHVGVQLAGAGIETFAFDLRGFGGSGGRRASIDRWSQLHDDVEERVAAIRSIDLARPVVVYGHSLGGLIVLGYVLDARSRPDLLVLSAPAIAAELPLWQRLLIGLLRHVAPGASLPNRLDPEVLCSDERVGEHYLADPLNQHRTSVRFAHAAIGEQARVFASLDRLSIPTLIVHGGDDRLVPTDSSEALEGRGGVTRRVYPDLRHETHNEPEGAKIVGETIGWIRERVSRLHAPGG